MKTIKMQVKSAPKASRLELFVRIIWAIIGSIVLAIFGIISFICMVLQWIYILIAGKRSKELNKVLKLYVLYRFRLEGYLLMLTDERSPLIPEE
ncbi:MAG: DUF4389 domain-containing protein [Candidatus Micrarchaeota archaeon]|nr:DUF4389 domain-containing protein [Candidatus Micrarchaeota archaeon]